MSDIIQTVPDSIVARESTQHPVESIVPANSAELQEATSQFAGECVCSQLPETKMRAPCSMHTSAQLEIGRKMGESPSLQVCAKIPPRSISERIEVCLRRMPFVGGVASRTWLEACHIDSQDAPPSPSWGRAHSQVEIAGLKLSAEESSMYCSCQVKLVTRTAVPRHRRHRTGGLDLERRALRAETLIQMGELSSARQALEGADLAKGDRRTLGLLTDVNKRPDHPRDSIPEELTAYEPMAMFDLDEQLFARNVRSSRRGAAGGPSGMTTEHLRPLLDDEGMQLSLVPQVAVDLIGWPTHCIVKTRWWSSWHRRR